MRLLNKALWMPLLIAAGALLALVLSPIEARAQLGGIKRCDCKDFWEWVG